MEKMVAVQKRLENALLILAEDADIQDRQRRIYHECLSHITLGDLPWVLRRDYYRLLSLTNMLYRGINHVNGHTAMMINDARQEMASALPGTLLLLLKRLTEWMAVESYLRSQPHAMS